jgi:hypothetical protein
MRENHEVGHSQVKEIDSQPRQFHEVEDRLNVGPCGDEVSGGAVDERV